MALLKGFVVCLCLSVALSSFVNSHKRGTSDSSMYDELKRLLDIDHHVDNLRHEAPSFQRRGISKRSIGTEVTMTTTLKNSILNMHNTARANVQPVPENSLPALTWNANLATTAKNWGLGCTWQHNAGRSNGYNGYVGENLGITKGYSTSDSISASVNGWINEKTDYNYATNTCAANKMCGHYTQVVWAATTEVGCALIDCPYMTNLGSYWNGAKYLVCNYLPGGNSCMSTPRPYEVGCPAK